MNLDRNRNGGDDLSYSEAFLHQPTLVDIIDFLERKPHLDAILLHQKYVVEGLSTREIAGEFFFTKNTIRNALIRFGIPLREKKQQNKSRSKAVYGYRKINGKLVPHVAEQRVVQNIVTMRDRDGHSYDQIAQFLNRLNIPTKKKSKKGWHREVVRGVYNSRKADISQTRSLIKII